MSLNFTISLFEMEELISKIRVEDSFNTTMFYIVELVDVADQS